MRHMLISAQHTEVLARSTAQHHVAPDRVQEQCAACHAIVLRHQASPGRLGARATLTSNIRQLRIAKNPELISV